MDNEEDSSGTSRRGAMIALVVVVVIVGVGVWLSGVMGSASRIQDCVMQGRSNCAPVR